MPAPSHKAPPCVLTIAGSDSGGGAGIQADLKTIAAHGLYGASVITAVTAQNTVAVTVVHEVPPAVVEAQIDAVFSDLEVTAVKIGMLSSPALLHQVAAGLRRHRPAFIVLDPVMVAKSGDTLLAEEAVAALVEDLLPLATLVTPNLPEAERLTGLPAAREEERRRLARRLAKSGPAVLVKGGHGEGEELLDLLFDGESFHRFVHPRLRSRSLHGTGCTLSSAIACRLALGDDMVTAVGEAVDYLHQAIAAAYPVGRGYGPVNHLHRIPSNP